MSETEEKKSKATVLLIGDDLLSSDEPVTALLSIRLRASFDALNVLSNYIHAENVKAGWWNDLKTGESILPESEKPRNVGELLCLVHSEISEAMEGFRKNLMDDKLPHRQQAEVELADALIRIFDIAGAYEFDLAGAVKEKLEYNQKRSDHKVENRKQDNGKKF